MRTQLPSHKGAEFPNFRPISVVVNWLDGSKCHLVWRCMPWPKRHCVRWGPSSPFPKGGIVPQFPAHIYYGQTAGCIKMPLGMGVGLGPGHIVYADPSPPKRGHSPQFSANVYCGHTAVWIKMPLGTKIGLGPCHIVLDGNPAPPSERCTAAPSFWPMSIVATVAHLSYC